MKLLLSIEKQLKAHGTQLEAIKEDAAEKQRVFERLVDAQQAIQLDLRAVTERMGTLERANAPERHAHETEEESQSAGALLKRLRRGDLRQDEDEGGGSGPAMGVIREGLLANVLGIRPPDMRNGIDGSRIISPKSPFYSCERPAHPRSAVGTGNTAPDLPSLIFTYLWSSLPLSASTSKNKCDGDASHDIVVWSDPPESSQNRLNYWEHNSRVLSRLS